MARKREHLTYGPCTYFERCGNQSDFKNTPLCRNCYSSTYYHLKKGVKHVMEWGGRLSLWTARFEGAAQQAKSFVPRRKLRRAS